MYSFVQNEKKKEIIDEMISKVDKNLMSVMCQVASGKEGNFQIGEGVIDKYLQTWAQAKYDIYILFGRQLKIGKEVDLAADERETKPIIDSVKNKFPIYAPVISRFNYDDIIMNKCPKNELFENACKGVYSPGMKLSKFFSKFFMDNQFDIEYSKILQNKKNKGFVGISIDPLDFLTMSTNKNSWASCYSLESWYYTTAPFSLMTDNNCAIAFQDNRSIYEYNLKKYNFQYYSKRSRSVVSINPSNCQIGFFRPQGSPGAQIVSLWKDILFDKIKETFADIDYLCVYGSANPRITYHRNSNESQGGYLYRNANRHTHIDDDATEFSFIPNKEKIKTILLGGPVFSLKDGHVCDASRSGGCPV